MAKEILNDEQKDFLVYSYSRGTSQTDLAKYFNVSRKTVWRILSERGELTNSLSADTRKMVRMLQNHHITPQKLALMLQMRSVTESQRSILDVAAGHQLGAEGLQQALSRPVLNTDNIVRYLADLSFKDFTFLTSRVAAVHHDRAVKQN